MSRARKHVREAIGAGSDAVERLLETGMVARVTDMRGTHCEVETSGGARLLVMVPTKFKAVVFIKKGGHVIVQLGDVPEDARFKIRGAIVHVLTPQQIAQLKKQAKWPTFSDDPKTTIATTAPAAVAPTLVDDDPFAGGNPNRQSKYEDEEDDDDEDEEEEEKEKDCDEEGRR
jgi:hypothetical protein